MDMDWKQEALTGGFEVVHEGGVARARPSLVRLHREARAVAVLAHHAPSYTRAAEQTRRVRGVPLQVPQAESGVVGRVRQPHDGLDEWLERPDREAGARQDRRIAVTAQPCSADAAARADGHAIEKEARAAPNARDAIGLDDLQARRALAACEQLGQAANAVRHHELLSAKGRAAAAAEHRVSEGVCASRRVGDHTAVRAGKA